jgi:hypothetical protein
VDYRGINAAVTYMNYHCPADQPGGPYRDLVLAVGAGENGEEPVGGSRVDGGGEVD